MKPGTDFTGIFVVFVCHNGQGKIFMTKRGKKARDENGKWEFGGGRIEFGESPTEAAARELFEEYNCKTIYSIEEFPSFNLVREINGQKTHWIGLPFLIQINPEEVKLNEADMIEDSGWFDLQSLPQPLHSGVQHALRRIKF